MANLFALRKKTLQRLTTEAVKKIKIKNGRKYTLGSTIITVKNMLTFLQETTNRRVGEDWLLINVGIRRGEHRLLISVWVRVGEDWLLDANTFSPWLGLSQHCYDVSH